MILHNRINRKELEEQLMNEPFTRATLSFYRYINIHHPQEFRNRLFMELSKLNCFGRIYVASEGINAQMSVPFYHKEQLIALLDSISELTSMPLKWAVDDDGKSFYKLTIKVRPKLVADGLTDGSYDVTNVGTHLDPLEFHKAMDDPETLVVDMRNHYESEIGRFENAIIADSDTFSEGIVKVAGMLENQKDKKILLYCTGGIRCEKASAYLKHKGFKNVSQLYGGIIAYANAIKRVNLPSKFVGKNFVFDRRLGEDIDGKVISHCHQCGNAANTHVNCANTSCHLLFIQCTECAKKYEGCCCSDCLEVTRMPHEEQAKIRVEKHKLYAKSKIFNRKKFA